MSDFMCGPDSMHPYACSHDVTCPHCTNAELDGHDPTECWLCCDGDPAIEKPKRYVKAEFAAPTTPEKEREA